MVGERGPTGDHGQDGRVGLTGPQGEQGPTNKLALVGYLILTVGVVLAFYFDHRDQQEIQANRVERVQQLNAVNTAQCESLANLYSVIRKSLEDADRAIDEISYYQLRPLERQQAHERNEATLFLFETPPCPANIALPPP